MFGFIPLVLWLYSKFPPRRAALVAFLAAWMFLPNTTYYFPGLPDFDKTFAATLAVLIATWLKDRQRLAAFRWRCYDLIMVLWCLTPLFSSISNGLGAYDGVAIANNYVTTWFAPYLIGRLYFDDWEAVRELLWGIFLGALIYAPLCWIEMILSPQLHHWVYGFHAHEFQQSIRAVGYRPTVFMQHGLMVGMWMAGGALAGLILWRWDGSVKTVLGWPLKTLVCLVLMTSVACQSLGAIIMLGGGFLVISLCRKFRTGTPLALIVLLPIVSIALKAGGLGTGQAIVDLVSEVSEERAASFEFRVLNEEMLVDKALEQPIFGWGGWGRSRIYDDLGNDISVTDSYWIIIFGKTGIFGLIMFALVMATPVISFVRNYPARLWREPAIARAVPLVALLALYFADCMVNDMKSPLYILIAGTISNLVALKTRQAGWDLVSPAVSVQDPVAHTSLLPKVL